MRRFEYRDGKSAKFWAIELQGRELTVSFGKIGGPGQTQTRQFPGEAAARKEYDKLVAEKLKKGYVEAAAGTPEPPPAPAAPPPPRAKKAAGGAGPTLPAREWPVEPFFRKLPGSLPLLQQVAEAPDDPTPRLLLADWLEQHGRPARAELIRVQCRLRALELQAAHPATADRGPWNNTGFERESLRGRAEALFVANRGEWLAGLPDPLGARWNVEQLTGGLLETLVIGSYPGGAELWEQAPLADWRRLHLPRRDPQALRDVLQLLQRPDAPRFASLRLDWGPRSPPGTPGRWRKRPAWLTSPRCTSNGRPSAPPRCGPWSAFPPSPPSP
jgi:uncharacterized protein (TIGR02996 family)